MYTLCVCAVFKNEAHILDEWITHYLNRGVDHIYLVNDFSNDGFQDIIDKFGDKITLYHNDIVTNEYGRQPQIYEKYFRQNLSSTKWIAILDLDEFLYSPETTYLPDILERYNDYSQILAYWLLFGSNGHIHQPTSVVNGFCMRAKLNIPDPNYSCKSIFKADCLINFNIHSHNIIGHTKYLLPNEDDDAPLIINHYAIQSLDYFKSVKMTRGDVNNEFNDTYNSNSTNKGRDLEYFKRYDTNDIEDNRLASQTFKNDVTLCITSCNRPFLLDKTLESFVKYNTYPIKETIIIDDSGKIGCNDDIIAKYTNILNIKPIYNDKNIGQIESIDKMYSYVKTPWIFHCEEDWEFLQPGFIEKSMKVFDENPEDPIFTIWLRSHNDTNGHPIEYDSLNRGYYEMSRYFSYMWDHRLVVWGGITFNPGLRRTSTCLKYHPYSEKCEKVYKNGKYYSDEYLMNDKYRKDGYYSCILSDPNGHVKHIGQNYHIIREIDN